MTTEELKQKVEDIVKEYLEEKKMPMKVDKEDADEDGKTDDMIPAFVDKGDVKKKKGGKGKVPPQLEPFVKGKKKDDKDEDEKEEVDEGSCGKRDPKEDDKPKYAKSQDKEHDDAKELGAKLSRVNENKTPQTKPEQSNEDWYWGSLYNKLKDKWTK